MVRGQSLYWYGRALAASGLIVIAPDIGQHELQHPNWSLMGERTWDAWRCVDYLATRPEVDTNRLAVAGLSLGGETTMYVAALDERLVERLARDEEHVGRPLGGAEAHARAARRVLRLGPLDAAVAAR